MTVLADIDSPRELLDDVRALRAMSADAERAILIRATKWADAHPALDPADGSWEHDDYPELPHVVWTAVPEFAAALRMPTASGSRLIQDALEARHRLPLCWEQLKAGNVEAWRLRMIAERTLLEPGDVVAEIDRHIAPVVGKIGSIKLDKLVNETLMRLHPEEWAERQRQSLEARYVKLFDQVTRNGVAEMHICADLADLLGFETAVSVVAARLAEQGDTDSLDVRRSKAVGILSDPAAAIELLTGKPADSGTAATGDVATRSDETGSDDASDGADSSNPEPEAPAKAATPARSTALVKPRRDVVLHVHLSEAAIAGNTNGTGTGAGAEAGAEAGADNVGRLERGDQPVLEQLIRSWCGRTDSNLKVYPVRDLNDHQGVGQYEAPDRLKSQVEQAVHTCVFPWCTRPARRCDKDHNVPHDEGGTTCSCNLAPLCRRHHRLKTHTAWRYETFDVGTYLWTSPFGKQYLRDNTGTIDVSPPNGPPRSSTRKHPDTGCFYDGG